MGKNKKDGGSNARMVTTVATAWTKITGRVPPTDLTDPKVTLPEALAWSIATGIVVETARFAIVRSTMRKPAPDTEAGS
jgi:Protein of unknown function (DUF4235)